MIPTLKTLLGALALSTASLAVQAHSAAGTATPRLDDRQARQLDRIAQGAASGALTAREQRRLYREQRAIGRAEAHAKADGRVTARERQQLEWMQQRASRHIYRQRHDAQTAWR